MIAKMTQKIKILKPTLTKTIKLYKNNGADISYF